MSRIVKQFTGLAELPLTIPITNKIMESTKQATEYMNIAFEPGCVNVKSVSPSAAICNINIR